MIQTKLAPIYTQMHQKKILVQIPLLILIGTIWIFASDRVPLTIKNVFPFVIVNTIFWGDWGTGREKYKKLQQAEMNRMKAKDIN